MRAGTHSSIGELLPRPVQVPYDALLAGHQHGIVEGRVDVIRLQVQIVKGRVGRREDVRLEGEFPAVVCVGGLGGNGARVRGGEDEGRE